MSEGNGSQDEVGSLDRYRSKVDFDDAVKVTHPADCSPDSCSLVGYKEDGELRYQEQTGKYPVVDPDTPDWNPRGCSRQCSFTDATYGDERIRQPMKQTGERGSDDWEPISWDEAYREIAEDVVDAVEYDPQSMVTELTPGEGGLTYGSVPFNTLMTSLGGLTLDGGALIGDFDPGQFITFGKFNHGPSDDDWFKSDLLLIWHANPAYSRNPSYHFLTEARYDGAEVVTIAPDHSPSAVHADRYVPVEPASDAALALGICRVLLDEELVHRGFVKEQTDLPFLVREDTDRYLRESDVEDDGSDERFYLWDTDDGLVQAPRETLELDGVDPALEGAFDVELSDGSDVTVRPVFELVRERLDDYGLDRVQELTGVHPDVVEELARKMSEGRTTVVNSFNQCKIFHGDLIVRAMALSLALTGNWGKEGAGGMRCWTLVSETGTMAELIEPDDMIASALQEVSDHELNEEEMSMEWFRTLTRLTGQAIPPVFHWYRHCGYDDVWDNVSLDDAGIPRETSEYIEEALEQGWWDHVDMPDGDVEPRVAFWVATNPVRRTGGGTRVLVEELWPKLDTIVTVDYRWSETALYSDIVLPAAFHHEKEQFDSMCDVKVRFWSYSNRAVEPQYSSKTEIEMMEELAREIEEVAEERGLESYEVPHGLTPEKLNDVVGFGETGLGRLDALPPNLDEMMGVERRYDTLYERTTYQTDTTEIETAYSEDSIEEYNEEITRGCIDADLFKEDLTMDEVREEGFVKYEGPGRSLFGLNTTHDVDTDGTVPLFTQHVEDKEPFPSLTGRAQFYIDHEWFLEADEHLPRHKEAPEVHDSDDGDHPLYVTSGHNRHSTHGITLANETQVNQHRGEPHLFLNPEAAKERGIEDGDPVRVYNDFGEYVVQAKLSSQPSEDQVVIYHAWDPYMFREGKGTHHITPGIVKPLHMAGGYGHLKYFVGAWQPQQVNRHTAVEVEPVEEDVDRSRGEGDGP